MPTDRENACFETGITLGALYHQFIGTPVSADSVEALERAMEDSAQEQIGVADATVNISGVEPNRFGYDELDGTMLDIDLQVNINGVTVTARMEDEDGYPMMRISDIDED